jgi:transposase
MGDSSPSFSIIKKWAAEFKRGRTSLEDDSREGRPRSETTPEISVFLRIKGQLRLQRCILLQTAV